MSLKEEILEILNTRKFYYKGIPMNAFLLPVFDNRKKQSIRNEFNRLSIKGYIDKRNGHFYINKEGKTFLEHYKQLKSFKDVGNIGPKNLLLIYDIPEDKKREREWFRRNLVKLSFIMIQKSVWVGPSPLPKEFIDYTKSIGLKDGIKTFKLEKDYLLNK